jgi:hypothetical protein
MANIVLRPDLRTSGGEVNDILLRGKYAGTLTLVYREGVRISGSIQLEKESLSRKDKDSVVEFAQEYVQSLIDALDVSESDVVVTYSEFDHIIATDNNVGTIREFVQNFDGDDLEDIDDDDYDYVEEDSRFDDIDPSGADTVEMEDDADAVYYELVNVGENKNRVEYHVYDKKQEWIAEAFITIYDADIVGEVNWMTYPSDDLVESITDLLVSDFDDDQIETIVLDMNYQGELFETIELAHEDLIDYIDEFDEQLQGADVDEDYSIVLSRDDGDTLTYDIYQQSHGGLPIGNATIDISQKQITGFIDFREPGSSEDREMIATVLMRELDKEKDYDTFSLTMLYQNEPIDELMFESDRVH